MRPVRVQDIFRAELDLLIKKPGISRRQYHFKNTSAQSSQSRSGDTHCRQPEQTENKDRVHHNITEQGTEIHDCRHYYPLHTAHYIEISLRHSDHDIGKCDDTQILYSFCDHGRI